LHESKQIMRILALFAAASLLQAQASRQPLTLGDAVSIAASRYPSIRVSQEQLAAAAAGINLARTSYLPRIDALGQINRATRNNVFGLLLPQTVIPSISGPVLGTNNLTNVWGGAVGVLVSWEPFDFGLREANVAVSEASRRRAEASVKRTEFEVTALTADAYLTLAAAEATVQAAQAGVDRARSIEQAVGAVVRAGLRPGVDLTRSQAERAFAETQLIQARQAADIARATLSQFVGLPAAELRPAPLAEPAALNESPEVAAHPLALEQTAVINEVKSREKALDRSYYPRFNLQGSAFARGSGANADGTTGGPFSGFGPDIQNWAVGLSVTFPVFDFASLRARKQIEAHNELAESARYGQILTELNGQLARARAALNGARLVAQNTPIQIRAAREAEQQATARYKTGLSTVVEVAEAQRLLTQAEIDDALAKLNIWRAELAVAAASGNLDPFISSTRQTGAKP
jgi:outer membrane protein